MAENKKEPMNNNRIKEVRLSKHKTQKDLAQLLGVSEQAIAYYEKALREPPLKSWVRMANYLNVPISYLQGISNDLEGWLDWEEATGHTKEQLVKEINRLIRSGYLNKKDGLQHQIGTAVASLDYDLPTTTQGAIKQISKKIRQIEAYTEEVFLQLPDRKDGVRFIPAGFEFKSKDGMDIEAYREISALLAETRYKLDEINHRSFNKKINSKKL